MDSIGSSDFLSFMAKHDLLIKFEHSAPIGNLKRNYASLVLRNGSNFGLISGGFANSGPVEVPQEILRDFIDASFVTQIGYADGDGNIWYELTDDGLQRGLD